MPYMPVHACLASAVYGVNNFKRTSWHDSWRSLVAVCCPSRAVLGRSGRTRSSHARSPHVDPVL